MGLYMSIFVTVLFFFGPLDVRLYRVSAEEPVPAPWPWLVRKAVQVEPILELWLGSNWRCLHPLASRSFAIRNQFLPNIQMDSVCLPRLLLVWRHSTLRFQSASSSSYTLNTGLFNAMVQDSCCHNGPAASETAWTAGRNIIVAARVCAWWSASMFLHAFWLGHIGAIEMPIVSFQCHLCQYLQLALQEGTTLYTLVNRL